MVVKFVNSAGSEVASLKINVSQQIGDTLISLEQLVGTPAKFIRLMYQGKILAAQNTLDDEGITEDCVIDLVKVNPTGDDLQLLSIESDDPVHAQFLLNCKADPNKAEDSSCYMTDITCLEDAVLRAFDKVAEVILLNERLDKAHMVERFAKNDFNPGPSNSEEALSHLLFEACLRGCERVVRHLLTHFLDQVDINFQGYFEHNIFGQRGPTGVNCFWAACVSGSVEIVKSLLEIATEYGENEGDMEPVKRGCESVIPRRINLNVMADYKRDQAFTGFWLACRAGHLDMVKLLVLGPEAKHNVPASWITKLGVNSPGELDRNMDLPIRFTTPFQAALLSGNIDLVNFLFDYREMCKLKIADKADVDMEEDGTVLQLACCFPAQHRLGDNGYLASCMEGKSVLHASEATVSNSSFTKQVLPLLFKYCFPTLVNQEIIQYVNRKSDTLQVTALWWACMYGNVGALRFLISEKLLECDQKVFLERDDALQRTPMWIACCNGHVDVVCFLMNECGVNPSAEEQRNVNRCSPFAVACAFARLDVIQKLLPVVRNSMQVGDWIDALLKVTCVRHEGYKMGMCFEDLDCDSSEHRSNCLSLLLNHCVKSEALVKALERDILPTLRNAPKTFRGRHVEYAEFPEWILTLENWLGVSQGQKRKASDVNS